MKFSRIELRNWKNFPQAGAELSDRVFIIGANASGKSNFLDAFRFLRDLALPGGGLAEACRLRGGVGALRYISAQKKSEIRITASASSTDGTIWTYILALVPHRDGAPRVAREVVVHRASTEMILLDRPTAEDRDDPERLTQTALEQTTANREFRELAEFFRSIRHSHLVPQALREGMVRPEFLVGEDAMGRDLLDRIAATPKRSRESRMKFLREVLKTAVPRLETLELVKDDKGHPHLQARFAQRDPTNGWQDEGQLSDGTLRLVGLVWSLLDGTGPLLLEEPELSLHPALLQGLAPLIHRTRKLTSGRQVFVSTHSEHLLRDPGIGGEEVLLVEPSGEGSTVTEAASIPGVETMMGVAGLSASEALLPRTNPQNMGMRSKVSF